jgi:hypothetical protein
MSSDFPELIGPIKPKWVVKYQHSIDMHSMGFSIYRYT